jgi:hypothetical protein
LGGAGQEYLAHIINRSIAQVRHFQGIGDTSDNFCLGFSPAKLLVRLSLRAAKGFQHLGVPNPIRGPQAGALFIYFFTDDVNVPNICPD